MKSGFPNKKERLQAYTWLYFALSSNSYNERYLCVLLSNWLDKWNRPVVHDSDDSIRLFPELIQVKPNLSYIGDPWWNGNLVVPRQRAILKMISLCEKSAD